MDGWMDGWMDRWMDGWMGDGGMDCVDIWIIILLVVLVSSLRQKNS